MIVRKIKINGKTLNISLSKEQLSWIEHFTDKQKEILYDELEKGVRESLEKAKTR